MSKTIFKVGDVAHRFQRLGVLKKGDYIVEEFNRSSDTIKVNGALYDACNFTLVPATKKRAHADLIIAWAEGAKIEFKSSDEWREADSPVWDKDTEYRIAREFPVTSCTPERLQGVFNSYKGGLLPSYVAVANEAIKQYILDTEKPIHIPV